MSVAPATSSSILVVITGVTQAPSVYSVVGTTLTFSTAPPSGTANISVRYLGIPASGVTTTAYRTLTEFTATASQTTFTPPSYTVGFIAVYQNGVMLGSTDYTATNGTTVVLAVGALVGDLVTTESFYVSSVLNALPVTGGTISGNLVVTGTASIAGVVGTASTGAITMPSGTTAQRPASPAVGMQRINTTTWVLEVYNGASWITIPSTLNTPSIDYLVVAGGGGNGVGFGAGGGAGGLLSGSTTITVGTTYSVVIGLGGITNGANTTGSSGGNSTALGLTAIGGGGGGHSSGPAGGSGGSGGGGSQPNIAGGAGTSGQGFAGGTGDGGNAAGGGGGAGAVGSAPIATVGGSGGIGAVTTLITTTQATANAIGAVVGSSVYFAGGGSGNGTGGSAAASSGGTAAGQGGAANTGAGGGGDGGIGGGSGCVLLSVPTVYYSGTTTGSPTVITNGTNTVIIFKASGSYTA